MRALFILHFSLLLAAPAFAQATDDRQIVPGLPSFPAVPNGSEITSSVEGEYLVVSIRIKSGLAFFRANGTRRQSYATTCPMLSLIAKIESAKEQRFVVQPENVHRHFDAPPKRISLSDQDGKDVGLVEIQSADAVVYKIRLAEVSHLGGSFIVIPGNPAIHRVEIKQAEQDGAGQPATRPESKSEGSDKPQPESEGRSR